MKINGKKSNESQRRDESKTKERQTSGRHDENSFRELLRKRKSQVRDNTGSMNEAGSRADEGSDRLPRLDSGARGDRKDAPFGFRAEPTREELTTGPSDTKKAGDARTREDAGEFLRSARLEGGEDSNAGHSGQERYSEDSLLPEDQRALIHGSVPGVAPAVDAENITTRPAQPMVPSHSKHEVTEKLLATIVSDGYVTEDVRGRKVVMMQVDIPGRGTVNMRLWRRSSGVELRMRADDPGLASEIRRNRGRLQSGARERGVHFTSIEVVG